MAELGVMHRKFTPEQEAKIVEEYKSKSVTMLAREYECCWQAMHGLLTRNGVEIRGKGTGPRKLAGKWNRKRSPEEIAEFKNLHEALANRQRETQQEVADRLGVSRSAIDLINSGRHWSCQFFGRPEARPQSKGSNGKFGISELPGRKTNPRAGSAVRANKALEQTQDRLGRAEAFNMMFELESE